MKIGVISDTHNYLDPLALRLLDGVDHILHGGDIGTSKVVQELGKLAPVTAVLGNTDDPGMHYRLVEVVQLGRWKFLVHHIVNPLALTEELTATISSERPNAVIFGHTHKPFAEHKEGILFLNPGYAGKTRFGMERTIAIVNATEKMLNVEFLPLNSDRSDYET